MDQFAQKIDITNSQQVLQYGSACQKKIGDFSEAALSKVSTKDLGEVGDMITDLIGELKSFDANEEQQKGIMGFFKKKTSQLDALKTKYDKTETNVEKIQSMLEAHQVQLLKLVNLLKAAESGLQDKFHPAAANGVVYNQLVALDKSLDFRRIPCRG